MHAGIIIVSFSDLRIFQIKCFLVHLDTKIEQNEFANIQLILLSDFIILYWDSIWFKSSLRESFRELLDCIFDWSLLKLIRKLVEVTQLVLFNFQQINKVLLLVGILRVNILLVVNFWWIWWFGRSDWLCLMVLHQIFISTTACSEKLDSSDRAWIFRLIV